MFQRSVVCVLSVVAAVIHGQGYPPPYWGGNGGLPNRNGPGNSFPNQMGPGNGFQNQIGPGNGFPNQMGPGNGFQNQMGPGNGFPNQMGPGIPPPNQFSPGIGFPNQMGPSGPGFGPLGGPPNPPLPPSPLMPPFPPSGFPPPPNNPNLGPGNNNGGATLNNGLGQRIQIPGSGAESGTLVPAQMVEAICLKNMTGVLNAIASAVPVCPYTGLGQEPQAFKSLQLRIANISLNNLNYACFFREIKWDTVNDVLDLNAVKTFFTDPNNAETTADFSTSVDQCNKATISQAPRFPASTPSEIVQNSLRQYFLECVLMNLDRICSASLIQMLESMSGMNATLLAGPVTSTANNIL